MTKIKRRRRRRRRSRRGMRREGGVGRGEHLAKRLCRSELH
jgi:hypothetical protein